MNKKNIFILLFLIIATIISLFGNSTVLIIASFVNLIICIICLGILMKIDDCTNNNQDD